MSHARRRQNAPRDGTLARETPETGPSWLKPFLASNWMPVLTLAVWSVALYARSLPYGLVDSDDDTYIFGDARLQSLSFEGVSQILTRSYFANYHPVTTLTYLVDHLVWGDFILGYRITHLAWYLAGVALLYVLFRRLLQSPGWALAGAALFAAHAVHVEAVVWLAQRKDLVCLVFYVAAFLAYLRYLDRGRSWRPYALAVLLAALAMLSKGYAVVLPAVFLAYDLVVTPRLERRQLVDKLPFAGVALAVIAVTVVAQESAQQAVDYSFGDRLVLLLKVFAVYVGKTILPVQLSALYVVGRAWLPGVVAVLGLALFVGALVAFVKLRRSEPNVALGIALFLLPLATVMNLFANLRVWMADRYLFLATIGSSLILAALARRLWERTPARRTLVAGLGAALVLFYGVATVLRIGVWSDPIQLWSDVVRKHSDLPGSGPLTRAELDSLHVKVDTNVLSYLAQAYGRAGEEAEAQALLGGVSQKRRDPLARIRTALEQRDVAEAERMARALETAGGWDAPGGWEVLGAWRGQAGELDLSRAAYTKALELHRASGRHGAEVMENLGLVELQSRNYDAAIAWYEKAREAQPADPRALLGLGATLEAVKRTAEALQAYEAGLALEGHTAPGIKFDFEELRRRAARLKPGSTP